ncbi:hypothetical protein RJT34_25105 [Clitoria ternatea]|uniref:Cytochrome P450 n=1 Tax=Clitoria ternatea TaxID=43366 RepID=A0AAN9IGJ6_CLITE
MSDLLGDGIFTVDGEQWRHQRKAASYQFSTKMLRNFSSSVFQTNAVKLARIVSEAAISNIIELQDLFLKSTLDFVCKVILGVELDTVCGNYKEGTEFSKAFDEASAALMFRYFNFLWKINRFLNIGSEAVLRRGKIQQQLLFPGSFTNSASILVQAKIAQEIREATNVANGSSIDELAARVTEENLEKMQYLHSALNETLRLHPAVPVCKERGDLVSFQPCVMGRMEFLWGEDAEEFRPERWLDENGIFQKESAFKFTAFQAGPRICLGKEFSYRQMKIYSAILLGSHSFKLAEPKKPIKYRTMLTLHIDGGIGMHVYPFQREK